MLLLPVPADNPCTRWEMGKVVQMLEFFACGFGPDDSNAQAVGAPSCSNCSKVLKKDAVKRCR